MRPRLFAVFLTCMAFASATPQTPAPLAIDFSRTKEAISPLIYGQFIEHLGRCIYGGIWAEMIEDRKFYFPITDEYAPYNREIASEYPAMKGSPWQVVGAKGSVRMRKETPFVGDHTPRVEAGSGIRHRDLEIVKGKSYSGYIWVHSAGQTPATVTVSLTGAERDVAIQAAPGEYTRHPFHFKATVSGPSELTLLVAGAAVDIGTLSLMPDDNVKGMRPDTLALLKQLNSPVYRWPGGNFVSGYDWRDGIGDRDRRPPRGNPAWTGVEHNDFGTDEFIAFCREINTKPMVAVNTGFGDDYSAAQWMEYLNGGKGTLGGSWRVKNGHAEPYGVKYFCVGNEMFGPWQLGFMQLAHYTEKHNRFARSMRKVDPAAILVGVGDINAINGKHDPDQAARGITWSEGMLEKSSEYMDMISEHFYEGRLPWTDRKRADLATHTAQLKTSIRERAVKHRALQARMPNLKGRTIPIAMDEWNYWHREYVYGELGCIYDWADGLGVARGLHEFFRNTDIIKLATYAQTVNVIGAIKTSRTQAELETTGVILALYRAQYGSRPLDVPDEVAGVDVAAALSDDGAELSIGLVNIASEEKAFSLVLTGGRQAGNARAWIVAGKSETEFNSPGKPRVIDAVEAPSVDPKDIRVPALSVVLVKVSLR
ncbi:MAG: alpha-L-arabinofuranosidase C-terminal domain-containing protein [Opitutaceae bacterium]|nr:alpha-L-arabinofuranosidase C-terminal domain-containing protein [Opitutaceae bacterium]